MLIEVQGLSKRYRPRGPMVVEEISFTIDRGETLAIFGDSGSGKSTIGQILAGIYPATAGEVRLDGQRLSYPLRGPARRRIQILFQHPEVAFNPKLRLIDSMREPYRLFHLPIPGRDCAIIWSATEFMRNTWTAFRRSSAEGSSNGLPWPVRC